MGILSNFISSILSTLRRMVVIALFTAFIYVLGLIPLFNVPGIGVPIVLQNMGVFLAGSILGPSGAFSLLLLLVLAAFGFPVLAGGRGSWAVFTGPTLGFLIGYVVVAFIVGFLVQSNWRNISFRKFFLINFLGVIVLYAIGIPIMALMTNISLKTAILSVVWFIPLDIVKIIVASYVAKLFKMYYPLMGYSSLSYGMGVSDSTGRQTKENIKIDIDRE